MDARGRWHRSCFACPPVRNLRVSVLLLLCAGCADSAKLVSSEPVVPEAIHGTDIVVPAVLRGLPVGPTGHAGVVAVTPCTTCHGREDPSPLPEAASQVSGPHMGLTLRHGTLRCAACHDAARRDQLHLADGRSIALLDAMELCAQCHGPQKRDYDHGAHGGMRGHWDLSRGPRERNHCVACHDPHAPAFGTFTPVAGPRDRFASQQGSAHE
jgi:hypothetical protein